MKRYISSIFISIISILSLSAQNKPDAQVIIKRLVHTLSTSTIKTDFVLSVSEKNNVISQSGSGTIILKDKKFMLDMDQAKAWFDGKTQWLYMAKSDEVSITEPSETELMQTNPVLIISALYLKSFTKFSHTTSAKNYIINMIPKTKKSNIKEVELEIDKSKMNPVSITIFDKNGRSTQLKLNHFQFDVKVPDNIFVFDHSKYKNATMNDLR